MFIEVWKFHWLVLFYLALASFAVRASKESTNKGIGQGNSSLPKLKFSQVVGVTNGIVIHHYDDIFMAFDQQDTLLLQVQLVPNSKVISIDGSQAFVLVMRDGLMVHPLQLFREKPPKTPPLPIPKVIIESVPVSNKSRMDQSPSPKPPDTLPPKKRALKLLEEDTLGLAKDEHVLAIFEKDVLGPAKHENVLDTLKEDVVGLAKDENVSDTRKENVWRLSEDEQLKMPTNTEKHDFAFEEDKRVPNDEEVPFQQALENITNDKESRKRKCISQDSSPDPHSETKLWPPQKQYRIQEEFWEQDPNTDHHSQASFDLDDFNNSENSEEDPLINEIILHDIAPETIAQDNVESNPMRLDERENVLMPFPNSIKESFKGSEGDKVFIFLIKDVIPEIRVVELVTTLQETFVSSLPSIEEAIDAFENLPVHALAFGIYDAELETVWPDMTEIDVEDDKKAPLMLEFIYKSLPSQVSTSSLVMEATSNILSLSDPNARVSASLSLQHRNAQLAFRGGGVVVVIRSGTLQLSENKEYDLYRPVVPDSEQASAFLNLELAPNDVVLVLLPLESGSKDRKGPKLLDLVGSFYSVSKSYFSEFFKNTFQNYGEDLVAFGAIVSIDTGLV